MRHFYLLTELPQGKHHVVQVHPEAEPPQARSLVGHSQGQLDRAASDLLSSHSDGRYKTLKALPPTPKNFFILIIVFIFVCQTALP